jgi:hypothetical protein
LCLSGSLTFPLLLSPDFALRLFAAWWWRYAHRSTHFFVEFDWAFKLNWHHLWQCNKCGLAASLVLGANFIALFVEQPNRVSDFLALLFDQHGQRDCE